MAAQAPEAERARSEVQPRRRRVCARCWVASWLHSDGLASAPRRSVSLLLLQTMMAPNEQRMRGSQSQGRLAAAAAAAAVAAAAAAETARLRWAAERPRWDLVGVRSTLWRRPAASQLAGQRVVPVTLHPMCLSLGNAGLRLWRREAANHSQRAGRESLPIPHRAALRWSYCCHCRCHGCCYCRSHGCCRHWKSV
jgi:hypothetical protein